MDNEETKPTNIIPFPKANPRMQQMVDKPTSVEDLKNKINAMDLLHVEATMNKIIPHMFNQMSVSGFNHNIQSPENKIIKDGTMIVESIRSFLMKMYGISHPLQIISDNIFEPDTDGSIKFKGSIRINTSDSSDATTKKQRTKKAKK